MAYEKETVSSAACVCDYTIQTKRGIDLKFLSYTFISAPRNSAINENRPNSAVLMTKNQTVEVDCTDFALISPYFREALFSRWTEAETGELNFANYSMFSGDYLSTLCTMLQEIRVRQGLNLHLQAIKIGDIFKLFDIASYLLIKTILQPISEEIMRRISAVSLVSAYHFAENRYLPLASELWKLNCAHLELLIENNSYLQLTADEILKLANSDRTCLEVVTRIDLYQKWIEANEGRSQEGEKIKRFLNENVGFGFMHVMQRFPNKTILASGGCEYNGHLKLVESYDMYRKRWVRSSLTTFQFPRAYHACIKFGKELYTIGGCNDVEQFNYTDRFNLDDQKCVQVASSFERRCYVGCARIDSDKLIAVGGYNGYERLAAAEIFHVSTNEWQRIRDMNTRRSDGHCVLLNDDVYAVCGFDGVNIHSTVEFYSAKQNRWINVPECMHKRRSGVGAVAIGGVIFVCGGFDGTYRLSSSEFLDPREGQWHYLTPMRQKRLVSNFGIELFNYEIVVAGGYRGQPGVTNFVEAFDFRANAWYELPSMNTRRSGLNLISLEDHDVIRQFLTCSSYAH